MSCHRYSALTEAVDALAYANDALQHAVTVNLKKLLGAIDARRSEAFTEKAFTDFTRPVRGDHAVMKKFAARAKVSA